MGKNWAICIGINQYDNLQRLDYAKRDAEAMRDYLHGELGCLPEQVYYFSDDSPPIPQDYGPEIRSRPTYATLRRFLRTRFEQPFLRPGDNLWFFFAGHGRRHADRDYLMPIDADPGDVPSTAIPLHDVTERLQRSGADNVILFVDACRSQSGRRDGMGIGQEQQQGVITFFSCSPNESSYEIEELQQGAFTYALLDSLRLQGEGNCATTERLYQRLRRTVPELNRLYQKPMQTPYGRIEPPTKNHLILLPRQATLSDVVMLKYAATQAEIKRDFVLAKQLWIRVLAVSPADPEGIDGIERLVQVSAQPAAVESPSPGVAGGSRGTAEAPVADRSVSKPSGSGSTDPRPVRPFPIQSIGSQTVISSGSESTDPRPVTPFLSIQSIQSIGSQTVISSGSEPTDLQPVAPSPPPAQPSTFRFEVVTVDNWGQVNQRRPGTAEYRREQLPGNVLLDLVKISTGAFMMGSPETEKERFSNEGPQHRVSVREFWMGKYAITQAQWRGVAGLPQVKGALNPEPSKFKGDSHPVEQVSWHDAVEFCARLSKHTGRQYRLPSEAEWEYACRAGTTTPFHFGATITPDLANYRGTETYGAGPEGEYREQTTEVGSFPPNPFGLYDMHGNVWEWCLDHWHDKYGGFFKKAPTDGSAWISGGNSDFQLVRGGSWDNYPWCCRCAQRSGARPDLRDLDLGFRVVCAST